MKLLYPFLLVAILPLVRMDYRFNESYPFVYIGHVWSVEGAKKQLNANKPTKQQQQKRGRKRERGMERERERERETNSELSRTACNRHKTKKKRS